MHPPEVDYPYRSGVRIFELLAIYFKVLRSDGNRTAFPIILQTIKLNHELRILSHCPSKRWEKTWMKNIDNYSKTVLNLQCSRCRCLAPFEVDTQFISLDVEAKCLICNSTNLISLPEVVNVKPISMVKHTSKLST